MLIPPPATIFLEKMKAKLWQNTVLKPNIKEGVDFMILNEEIFEIIRKSHGVNDGHEVIRYGIEANEETKEAVVELYLRPVRFFPCPNTLFKIKEPLTVLISRKDTVGELIKKF